jgi:hypothetical protein
VAPLAPLTGSRVSGTATLAAVGSATRITWTVSGMMPGSSLRTSLHAGTCVLPSASFRYLATLTADAIAAPTASATTDLPFSLLADGDHIIELQGAACGAIPAVVGVAVTREPAPAVAVACAFTFPDSQPLRVLPHMGGGSATVTRVRGAGITFTLTRFPGFNITVRRAFGRTPPAGDTVEPFNMALPDGHSYAGLTNVVRDGDRAVVCLRGIAYRDQGNGAAPGLAPPAVVRLDGTISAGFARVDLYAGTAHYYVYGRPAILP